MIEFDGSNGELPTCPAGTRLRMLTFRTCREGSLQIVLVVLNGPLHSFRGITDLFDEHGLASDSWWVVRSTGLPDRAMRITTGKRGMSNLIRRYGFLDATGCVNHKQVCAHYEHQTTPLAPFQLQVPSHLIDAKGVPQFFPNSGICWFASCCTVMFSDPNVTAQLRPFFPPDLLALGQKSLHSRECAKEFRDRCWKDYAVGDNIENPPEMDGKNGFTEFSLLCAKLNIPLLRYREHSGRFEPMGATLRDHSGNSVNVTVPATLDDFHFLAFRFTDGDHTKYPLYRRLVFQNRRYKLVGWWAGQKKCGHQIGVASSNGSWNDMIIGDADMHKDGIGPVFIHFDRSATEDEWWKAWKDLVYVTKFGPGTREFCNLSPWNQADNSLDRYRGSPKANVGQCSIDVLYVKAATH